ncbi:MAG TPA: SHOCT domain-containing protein [Actinobacteria bacterium]|nr:SHOCT domain-containing protein [Actinomycetota bacterium]
MMDGSGFGIIGMLFGLFITLLFVVGIIVLIIWIVKQFAPGGTSGTTSSSTGGSNALDILEERFAKGEISKEEYADMKKELRK